MVNNSNYYKLLDNGLSLDHYLILQLISENKPFMRSKRIQGYINFLEKKGLLCEGVITKYGRTILELDIFNKEEIKSSCSDIYKSSQKLIQELTGNTQVKVFIKDKSWQFFPNEVDFCSKLSSAIKKYKMKDSDKIEKCIHNFIRSCHSSGKWIPLLKYYIMKDSNSDLATDYSNNELLNEKENDQYDIKEVKGMF